MGRGNAPSRVPQCLRHAKCVNEIRPALPYYVASDCVQYIFSGLRCSTQVELGEREARSLYRQLDTDHDGALGAEDLVRGASVLGEQNSGSRV